MSDQPVSTEPNHSHKPDSVRSLGSRAQPWGSALVVTGAGGFVGQFVALGLHKLGFSILASGRASQPPAAIQQAGIQWRPAQLDQINHCHQIVQGATHIIHCAGRSSPTGPWSDFARDNLIALQNLINASQSIKGFYHLSSSGVYFGGHPSPSPRSETHPLPDNYPAHYRYLWSKRIAEEILRHSGLPWTIIRPRAIYGPGDRSLFPRIQAQLLKGRLPILGDGQNLTSLTHVQHLLDLIVLLIQSPTQQTGTIWNISDGPPVLLWELFQQIAHRIGAPPIARQISQAKAHRIAHLLELAGQLSGREPSLTRYTVDLLSNTQTLDISKAQLLGFKPRFSSLQGVMETVQQAHI